MKWLWPLSLVFLLTGAAAPETKKCEELVMEFRRAQDTVNHRDVTTMTPAEIEQQNQDHIALRHARNTLVKTLNPDGSEDLAASEAACAPHLQRMKTVK